GARVTVPAVEEGSPSSARAPGGAGLHVVVEIHRDDALLVVGKPPGVPCHGGAGLGVRRTLLKLLKPDVLAGFGLVHRIDQDTSGLVVLARGDLKRALMESFATEGAVD